MWIKLDSRHNSISPGISRYTGTMFVNINNTTVILKTGRRYVVYVNDGEYVIDESETEKIESELI
jgi:hypothetical protein